MVVHTALLRVRNWKTLLGEIFMPIQMICWIFLMKMNLPEASFPQVAEIPRVDISGDYSPALCRFNQWAEPQSCLESEMDNPIRSIPEIVFGYTPDSPVMQELVNRSIRATLAAQSNVTTLRMTVQGYSNAGAMSGAMSLDERCQPPTSGCFGLEIPGADTTALPTSISYTIYTGAGLLPEDNPTAGADACRPYWKALQPPEPYPGADETAAYERKILPTECESSKYLRWGYVAVQGAVDRGIWQMRLPDSPNELSIWVQPLPRPAYDQTFGNSASAFRPLLSFYIVLGLGFSVSATVTSLVEAKEKKLREGQVVMGLRYSVGLASSVLVHVAMQIIVTLGGVGVLYAIGVLRHSNVFLVWLLLFTFAISLVMLSFAISVLYDKARSAGGSSQMFVMVGAAPFIAIQYIDTSTSALFAGSLFSPFGFCLGMDAVFSFDGGWGGMEGVSWGTFDTLGPLGVSPAQMLIMLWVDVALYTIMTLYLDTVVPQNLWATLPPWFLCTRHWWRSKCGSQHDSLVAVAAAEDTLDTCVREHVMPTGCELVRMKRVTKTFKKTHCTPRSSVDAVRAVDGVTLSLHSNQIFGLLGHNGAGKTTLMNILAGIHSPDSGQVLVDGLDVVQSIDHVRQSLGVCPQHDLLFKELTVMEHMCFYGSIKGVRQIKEESDNWLSKVGLAEKANELANTLSGGQKRRLSVAMSMIGEPRVVYLDEPTTGLDPAARRSLWATLKAARNGRLIVLSTHFMDEADLLADQKAIIAHGRLRCVGSSMFLKSHFGLGYCLELSKQSRTAPVDKIEALVAAHTPSAQLTINSDTECHFKLPPDTAHTLPLLLTELEHDELALEIESYCVTIGTLQEIFMRFADGGDLEHEDSKLNQDAPKAPKPAANAEDTLEHVVRVEPAEEVQAFSFRKAWAMTRTFWVLALRNQQTFTIAFLIPIILLIVLAFIKDPNSAPTDSDPEPVHFTLDRLGGSAPQTLFVCLGESTAATFGQLSTWLKQQSNLNVECWDGMSDTECKPATGCNSSIGAGFLDGRVSNTVRAVVSFDEVGLPPATLAWSITIHYNPLEADVMPTYTALISSLFLAASDTNSSSSISASTKPFPTKSEVTWQFSATPIMMIFILLFPAATLVAMVVRDVELKTRFQLSVMGLSSSEFWLGLFLQNVTLFYMVGFASLISIKISGIEPMAGDAFGAFCCLILVFVPAMTLFCYLLSNLFSKHETALKVAPSLLQMTSMFLVMPIQILMFFPDVRSTVHTVHAVLCFIFPQYAIIGAIVMMQYQHVMVEMGLQESESYFRNSDVRVTFLAFFVQMIIYPIMLVSIDRARHSNRALIESDGSSDIDAVTDEDVIAEHDAAKAAAAGATPDGEEIAIRTLSLHKAYASADKQPPIIAVRNLSLAIRKRECLGLLGPNGAGKTTTIRSLTAEETISGGQAYVSGFDVRTQAHKVWRSLGVCPQHDAIW
eukprot:SAG31_NODE_1684_length_7534_cov_6.461870_3_plen_1457_part_00